MPSEKIDVPQSKKELESFQGMMNYIKWYSSRLTRVAEPLKELLRKDMTVVLGVQTPESIQSHQGRANQDPSPGLLWPKGRPHHPGGWIHEVLGAVLLQKGNPVIYVSRTLTLVETGYSNIERELLSTVFGLERLHHYTFGSKVKVQTDHKPLIPIWRKSIVAANPQLQQLLLQLAKYDAELTYL